MNHRDAIAVAEIMVNAADERPGIYSAELNVNIVKHVVTFARKPTKTEYQVFMVNPADDEFVPDFDFTCWTRNAAINCAAMMLEYGHIGGGVR